MIVQEHTARTKPPIAAAGYEPAYGARPLKRALQRLLQDPLAMHLLEETAEAGARILVDLDPEGEGLLFRRV